jgi:hypothetical protein
MIAEHTTEDGFTLCVFSACYLDYGLKITDAGGNELFYNPCCLSNESYGAHYEDEDGELLDEGIPWTDEEWKECLADEADDHLEAFLPPELLE